MPPMREPQPSRRLGLDIPTEPRALTSPVAIEVDRLGQLATEINREHAAAQSSLRAGLEHAQAAGVLLLEARGLCPYGTWLPWLREHFVGSERTAQAYMRVAREWDRLTEGNPQHVADLPYREALQALAAPADPESDALDAPPAPHLSERLIQDLAAAPPPVRLEVMRQAITGAHPRELRALMRHASAELALAAPAPTTRPDDLPRRRLERDDVQIEVLDAAHTCIADGVFDLIISSPPYALDVPYADGGDVPDYPTYRRCMAEWAAELYRVSNADHGRVCLEVPVDRSKAGTYEPVYAHWLQALEGAGFAYRTTIFRRYHAGRGTARGSVDSPAGPHTFAPLLAIIVIYRGEWLRRSDQAHDLGHEDWLALAGPNGYWDDLPGEDDPAHPAPFHLEVPRRLLKLYSYREDLVGDLFLGRGTTALACVELGRRFRGGDRSATYVAIAEARVARVLQRPRGVSRLAVDAG